MIVKRKLFSSLEEREFGVVKIANKAAKRAAEVLKGQRNLGRVRNYISPDKLSKIEKFNPKGEFMQSSKFKDALAVKGSRLGKGMDYRRGTNNIMDSINNRALAAESGYKNLARQSSKFY